MDLATTCGGCSFREESLGMFFGANGIGIAQSLLKCTPQEMPKRPYNILPILVSILICKQNIDINVSTN